MPELPEAERSRRAVADGCLNRTIEAAEPGDDVSYIDLPGGNERQRLVGHQFTETRRHGKLIFAGAKTGPWIAVHLGMSGRLITFDDGDGAPDHTKFLITFAGDRRLAFRCPRKLGWLKVVDDPDDFIGDIGFGPDILEISQDAFVEILAGTNGAVKSALMAQRKMAGIGNLWSDEILYQVGISPTAKASDISEAKLRETYESAQDILKAVLKVNADYSKLPDDWLIHTRKAGADCPRCGGTIRKKTVGGRSAFHCPDHQTAP